MHAIGDGPLSWQYQAISTTDICNITGNTHICFGCDLAQGLRHRAQITHPVIDYDDLVHTGEIVLFKTTGNVMDYRLPLVEGIVPAARGSSSSAMRNARPKALNTVSHW